MLFTIRDIETEKNVILVSGSTAIGDIKGIWHYKNLPLIGESYNIELDFGTIDRNSVIINTNTTSANSRIMYDKIIFTGLCEDIDEVYYIIFSDGLEMLDITNDDFTIKKGDFLSFALLFSEIGIYPY